MLYLNLYQGGWRPYAGRMVSVQDVKTYFILYSLIYKS